MSFTKSTVTTMLCFACAVCLMHGNSSAQVGHAPTAQTMSKSRTDWERAVLQPRNSRSIRTASARNAISSQSAYRLANAPTQKLRPTASEDNAANMIDPMYGSMAPGMDCNTCGVYGCTTNEFGSPCGLQDECYGGICSRPRHWRGLFHKFSFFAGVEGFKGPLDRGRNGNFGFHEGINFGAPLGGGTQLGYQLGVLATQSNFYGEQVVQYQRADRDQCFFTGGIFKRALCGGLQYGIAFDWLHDSYYRKSNLGQIRANISLVRGCQREIGFWTAIGTKSDDVSTGEYSTAVEVNDQFAFYYRRYFKNGGEGRLWFGFTNNKDGIIGGDIRVPIGGSFALENNFNYVLPRDGRDSAGQLKESWNVAIRIVWYPGRPACSVRQNPFNPLFNVADNTYFMTRLK